MEEKQSLISDDPPREYKDKSDYLGIPTGYNKGVRK